MEKICSEPLQPVGTLFAAQYAKGGKPVYYIVIHVISSHLIDAFFEPDKLLCHDDKLEGRRIAFNLYLVPDDWREEDGGDLAFFGVNCKFSQP